MAQRVLLFILLFLTLPLAAYGIYEAAVVNDAALATPVIIAAAALMLFFEIFVFGRQYKRKQWIWLGFNFAVFWVGFMVLGIIVSLAYLVLGFEAGETQVMLDGPYYHFVQRPPPDVDTSSHGTCRVCHKPLQFDSEFCMYCGATVAGHPKVCPNCATVTLPDAKWCPKCRTSLSGSH